MRQGTATAKVKSARDCAQMKARVKPAKTRSRRLTKSELAENENDAAADFIVGALLYSLLASNCSGMVSELMSKDGSE